MIWERMVRWFRGARLRREIDEEIQFHLDMRKAEYQSNGMSSREAIRTARSRFGDIEFTRRKVHRVRHVPTLDNAGVIDGMWQDLRFAFRGFVKQPGFAILAILTLALGIGANTAIYSLVDSVILNPLPFDDGDRLAWLWRSRAGGMMVTPRVEQVRLWREAEQLEGMVNLGGGKVTLQTGDGVEALESGRVPPEVFTFLNVSSVTGRPFVVTDSAAGSPNVVLLGEGYWRTRHGGDPGVIGDHLTLDDEPHEIVGIAPAAFDALFRSGVNDVWLPLKNADSLRGMITLVKIRDGTTFESVQAELDAIHTERVAATDGDWKPKLVRPHMMISSQLRSGLWVLMGSVGLVLLIACANVANMLLARGVGRQHELAIRAALGAGKMRLGRQLFVESLTLSTVGAMAGIAIAYVSIYFVRTTVPSGLIELSRATLSVNVLAVGVIAGVGSGLLFGLAPVLQGTRGRITERLHQGTRGGDSAHRSRLRQALVGLEVALAFVLFIGAGLLLRSFANLSRVDPGFDAERLVSVSIDLPEARYASSAAKVAFVDDVVERVRQLPPVASATVAVGVPPQMGAMLSAVELEGREGTRDSEAGVLSSNWVLPGYFETLGMRFIEGRGFLERDDYRSVVVINEQFAREMWAGETAVGKRFRWESAETWMTVLGVVQDVRAFGLTDDPNRGQVYQLYDPERFFASGVVLARASGDPEDIIGLVRGQISAVDPSLPILNASTIAHLYADSIARPRFNTFLLSCFAALALTLAITGVYGVIALTMNQRMREIGVRMALGARQTDVKLLALRWGVRPVIVGTLVGIAVSLAIGRVIEGLLFDVSPADPMTFGVVTGVMILVGAVATYVPAQRAARVDPANTLRTD